MRGGAASGGAQAARLASAWRIGCGAARKATNKIMAQAAYNQMAAHLGGGSIWRQQSASRQSERAEGRHLSLKALSWRSGGEVAHQAAQAGHADALTELSSGERALRCTGDRKNQALEVRQRLEELTRW